MRIYHVRRGYYIGDYPIYEGVEEYQKKEKTDNIPFKWHDGTLEELRKVDTGDFIESTDGYVMQILRKYKMKDKKCPKKETYGFKFPMGSFVVYSYNDKVRYPRLCAFFTTIDTNSFSGKEFHYSRDPKIKYNKILFGSLIISGVEPIEAYKRAGFPYVPKYLIQSKIGNLIMSEDVQVAFKKELEPYIEKIKKDERFSDEKMVEYVHEFMENVKKGSLTHLQSIIPLLTLLGKIKPKSTTNKKNWKNIDEAEWEDTAPPK